MQLMYPWFLAGLLAVTIPVIIHLLELRKPQRLLFTNIAFIRDAELVAIRHRKVRQWVLLLTRVAGIAALVVAFCQPFIVEENSRGKQFSNRAEVLVDDSYSMLAKNAEEGSALDNALMQARKLSEGISSQYRFKLLNSGQNLITPSVYRTKLDELRASSRPPLAKIGFQNGTNEELYVFSDFQRNTFSKESLGLVGRQKQVILVPIVEKPVANVYVDSIWLDDAFVRLRTNVGLHVQLRNGGKLGARDCPVKIFLGERQVAAFRVTVEPGQVAASVVQVQVGDAALALGRVVTEDAAVAFDNVFYFTLQPASAIRVLEIGSEPIAERLYGNEPLFSYSFQKPQSVNFALLKGADLVLVREINEVDAGIRNGLKAVLQRGGSVVVVPSAEHVAHNSYQTLFEELGLGAVQWEDETATPELREVAMPSAQEPFFREVFGAQQRAVTMPRVAPVLRWSRTGTDILRLRDGASYLASFASSGGSVYVFTAPFAKAYSDFVAHALFVPVMYRMAMLSYRSEQLPAYRLTRRTVTLQLPGTQVAEAEGARQADEAGFRFVKDSTTLIPAQRVIGQEVRLELPLGMDAPGFYQVQRRGKLLTTLAFNLDKKESELAAYSADELREMIGLDRPNVRVLESGVDGAGLTKSRAAQVGPPLWRYFIALALACLLAEALVVRFGARRVNGTSIRAF